MTIKVQAIARGYWTDPVSKTSKIMEAGDMFTISSIEQFSRGFKGRKTKRHPSGRPTQGWMRIEGISKDHKEPTPELEAQLKEVLAMAKEQLPEEDEFEDVSNFQSINEVEVEGETPAEEEAPEPEEAVEEEGELEEPSEEEEELI